MSIRNTTGTAGLTPSWSDLTASHHRERESANDPFGSHLTRRTARENRSSRDETSETNPTNAAPPDADSPANPRDATSAKNAEAATAGSVALPDTVESSLANEQAAATAEPADSNPDKTGISASSDSILVSDPQAASSPATFVSPPDDETNGSAESAGTLPPVSPRDDLTGSPPPAIGETGPGIDSAEGGDEDVARGLPGSTLTDLSPGTRPGGTSSATTKTGSTAASGVHAATASFRVSSDSGARPSASAGATGTPVPLALTPSATQRVSSQTAAITEAGTAVSLAAELVAAAKSARPATGGGSVVATTIPGGTTGNPPPGTLAAILANITGTAFSGTPLSSASLSIEVLPSEAAIPEADGAGGTGTNSVSGQSSSSQPLSGQSSTGILKGLASALSPGMLLNKAAESFPLPASDSAQGSAETPSILLSSSRRNRIAAALSDLRSGREETPSLDNSEETSTDDGTTILPSNSLSALFHANGLSAPDAGQNDFAGTLVATTASGSATFPGPATPLSQTGTAGDSTSNSATDATTSTSLTSGSTVPITQLPTQLGAWLASSGERESSLAIELSPQGLGRVRISVRRQEQSLEVELVADQSSTRDLLAADLPKLTETLGSWGVAPDQLQVTLSTDAGGNSATDSNSSSRESSGSSLPSRRGISAAGTPAAVSSSTASQSLSSGLRWDRVDLQI